MTAPKIKKKEKDADKEKDAKDKDAKDVKDVKDKDAKDPLDEGVGNVERPKVKMVVMTKVQVRASVAVVTRRSTLVRASSSWSLTKGMQSCPPIRANGQIVHLVVRWKDVHWKVLASELDDPSRP